MGKLQELPVWIQEGNLGIQSVEFDVLRGGQRTKQNVAEHAEAVFQGAQSAEQVAIADLHNVDQLLDGVVANSDLVLLCFVLQV